MPSDKQIRKFIDGRVLDDIHPQSKGLKPGYSRTIEVLYTDGKIGDWSETTSARVGVTGVQYRSSVRADARHLYAKVLIDVRACIMSGSSGSLGLSMSGPGKMTIHKPNAEKSKDLVFHTFCHESFHALQCWLIGSEEFSKRYISELDKVGYRGNRYENAAFDRASDIHNNHKLLKRLRNSVYDKILPLEMIKRIANE